MSIRTIPSPKTFGGNASVLRAEIVGNTASQVALPENPGRTHAVIVNVASSTTPVWLGLGVDAQANKGIRLDPGAALQFDADWSYTGAINFYGASTATIAVWEA